MVSGLAAPRWRWSTPPSSRALRRASSCVRTDHRNDRARSIQRAVRRRPRRTGERSGGRRRRIGRRKQLRKEEHRHQTINVEIEIPIVVPTKLAIITWTGELAGRGGYVIGARRKLVDRAMGVSAVRVDLHISRTGDSELLSMSPRTERSGSWFPTRRLREPGAAGADVLSRWVS
jgi:hypothetical protein